MILISNTEVLVGNWIFFKPVNEAGGHGNKNSIYLGATFENCLINQRGNLASFNRTC